MHPRAGDRRPPAASTRAHLDDGHGDHDPPSGLDPHIWLDPILVKVAGGQRLATSCAAAPTSCAEFDAQPRRLQTELDEVDRRMRDHPGPDRRPDPVRVPPRLRLPRAPLRPAPGGGGGERQGADAAPAGAARGRGPEGRASGALFVQPQFLATAPARSPTALGWPDGRARPAGSGPRGEPRADGAADRGRWDSEARRDPRRSRSTGCRSASTAATRPRGRHPDRRRRSTSPRDRPQRRRQDDPAQAHPRAARADEPAGSGSSARRRCGRATGSATCRSTRHPRSELPGARARRRADGPPRTPRRLVGPFDRADRRPPRPRRSTQVGLASLERRPFADLSGGQRQRVLLARALASRPGAAAARRAGIRPRPEGGARLLRTAARAQPDHRPSCWYRTTSASCSPSSGR